MKHPLTTALHPETDDLSFAREVAELKIALAPATGDKPEGIPMRISFSPKPEPKEQD